MPFTRFVLACAAITSVAHAQFVQLPDNHYLGKSATQLQAAGTANYWAGATPTGRRFQVLYDASHFTGVQGVVSPILIRHVRFRGEDTEHNVGGQTYTNVIANLYSTTLTSAAALNVAFASNLPPIVPTSTLLGSLSANVVTVAPSIGRAPNNDNIDLDFTISTVPMLPFDPTGPQPNLLVDIQYSGAANAPDPQSSTIVAIQDTAGTTAFIRGRALFASPVTAATGTGSTTPPTMRIEFLSAAAPGGFPVLQPARNERYGAACGGTCSTFYQLFSHDTYMDLRDPGQVDLLVGLRLIPNVYPAPAFYTVVGGAAPVDLVNGLLAAPTTQGDDDTMVHNLPPGVTFSYPGGSTNVVRPSSNGYVIVDPASTEGTAVPGNFAGDFSPTVAELLGTPITNLARFAPFWHDLSPNKNATAPFGDPLSGLHIVNSVATTEVLATWYRVGRFNSVTPVFQESHTMQCSLNWTTGVVEFRYGPMDEIWGDTFGGATSGIVGFSRGAIGGLPSRDPQSRDLSIERPFSTQIEGATSNLGLSAVSAPIVSGAVYQGRGFVGQSLRWNVNNVPAGALLGVQLLDTAASRPGLTVPFLVVPGCMLSVTPAAVLFEVTLLPPATVNGVIPLAVPGGYQPALMGFDIFAQYVVLDGLFLGGPLITSASNAIRHTIGQN